MFGGCGGWNQGLAIKGQTGVTLWRGPGGRCSTAAKGPLTSRDGMPASIRPDLQHESHTAAVQPVFHMHRATEADGRLAHDGQAQA